jgi:uroporphyrinogen decarboxylase
MQGSVERVRAVINGEMPDRAPLYELFRNDAVISHFAGRTLTLENCAEVVYRAYAPALDATRPAVRMPDEEGTTVLEDGRKQRRFRWTMWTEHRRYPDVDAYVSAKRRELDAFDPAWNREKQAAMDSTLATIAEQKQRLGEVFFFPGGPGMGLMGIFGEVGLEQFAYYLADRPDIIEAQLECQTVRTISWLKHLPRDHGIEAVFMGDDIAFTSGPMLSPQWFKDHYFHRMKRVIDAYHAQGIKTLFHSDGDLNLVLDGLVEAGIDGLNPIEVLAGMDVADIHRRYPHLFMAGGIDVSQLLPFGSPGEVKDTVRRTIDAAGGRIMIGSSTELHNDVPLENYLALREAVLDHPYRS